MNSTKQPGLMDAPVKPEQSFNEQQWTQQITEVLRLGLGQTADQSQKFVTWTDMEEAGMVTSGGGAGSGSSGGGYWPTPNDPPPPDLTPPPPLERVAASGGMTAIYISWDNPLLSYNYYVEVHKASEDDVGKAVLIGTTNGTIYEHLAGSDKNLYYFWARVIKQVTGQLIIGPWNSTYGVTAQAALDPEWILGQLEGQIDDSHLNDMLSGEIGKIEPIQVDISQLETGLTHEITERQTQDESLSAKVDANVSRIEGNEAAIVTESMTRASEDEALASEITTLVAEVDNNKAAIQSEQTVRADEDEALTSNITQLEASVGSNTAAILTEQTTRASEDEALASSITTVQADLNGVEGAVQTNSTAIAEVEGDITSITTEYTVKLDSDGYVGGFGLVNDGNVITALWRVDVFGVGAPGSDTLTFAIDAQENRVVMDGAYIMDATITDAKIGSLTVEKLIGGTADFVEANILNGSITNAKIGNVIQSDNYVTNQSGWIINKDGFAQFMNVFVSGTVSASTFIGCDGDFSGTVYAENIEGDVVSFAATYLSDKNYGEGITSNKWYTIANITLLTSADFNRYISIDALQIYQYNCGFALRVYSDTDGVIWMASHNTTANNTVLALPYGLVSSSAKVIKVQIIRYTTTGTNYLNILSGTLRCFIGKSRDVSINPVLFSELKPDDE